MHQNAESRFEEVDLRPESERATPACAPRPSSTSKIGDFFRKTFTRKKRRATTTVAESDLVKNSISRPGACSEVLFSEEDFEFSRSSIQSCPFDISGYGSFILNNEFKVQKPQKTTVMVFMFEQIIIFTKKQPNEEAFYYIGSLKLDHLALLPPNKNKKILEVKDHFTSTKFHKDVIFSLEASSEYVQTQWRKAIERCLWRQLLKAKKQSLLPKS